MRPSLWTGMFHRFSVAEHTIPCNIPMEDAIQRLSAVGFRAAEFCGTYLDELSSRANSLESARRLRSLCDEKKLALPQAHGPDLPFASNDDSERDNACATVESLFPLLEILGVRTLVLHPGQPEEPQAENLADLMPWTVSWNDCLRLNAESFQRLSGGSGNFEIRIALENLIDGKNPGRRIFGAYPVDLEMLFAEVSELGLNLDTAHAHSQHLDLPVLIHHFGQRLYGLHVSDNHGEFYDKHLVPGKGTINWSKVITALKDVGYKGDFHMELPDEWGGSIEATTRAAHEAYHAAVNLLEGKWS